MFFFSNKKDRNGKKRFICSGIRSLVEYLIIWTLKVNLFGMNFSRMHKWNNHLNRNIPKHFLFFVNTFRELKGDIQALYSHTWSPEEGQCSLLVWEKWYFPLQQAQLQPHLCCKVGRDHEFHALQLCCHARFLQLWTEEVLISDRWSEPIVCHWKCSSNSSYKMKTAKARM